MLKNVSREKVHNFKTNLLFSFHSEFKKINKVYCNGCRSYARCAVLFIHA